MRFGIAVLLFGALCACQQHAAPAAKSGAAAQTASAAAARRPAGALPQNREVDDTARFLAGMPGKPGSPFAELENDPAWQEHRQLMDDAWDKADKSIFQGLREFQTTELSEPRVEQATVFYPFSGPDTITPTLSFPHNPVYLLVALEPAGTFPTHEKIAHKHLDEYLGSLRSTMASDLGKSFFVTREMDRQFRGQVTDGLLIPILHSLARTGHTILGFRYVRVNEEGKVEERPLHVDAKHANKGLQIEFLTDADQSFHTMYYFSLNLSDARLQGNKGFLQYMDGVRNATTLLKATSYMTHHKEFSTIRDLVLRHSATILQDDSGIPYNRFTSGEWKVQLYGDYIKPYGSFGWLEQPDLRKAYQAGTARPLSMHIGYGFQKITSNLLLAKRIAPTP